MFSITVKLMKKSARMLIPAGIAILIGTAFIAATFLFGNAMNDSLARQTTAQLGGANYVISANASDGLSEQEQNDIYARTVNDFQLDRIRATEGVKDVRVESSSSVTVANGDKHASSYAITTAAQRDLLPVSIIQGDQPVDSNEIALTKSVADQLGVKVGDSVTVNSRTAQAVASTGYGSAGNDTAADSGMTVRVVGITEDPNGAYAYYGGASVLSDNVITAMNGIDDFGKLNVYLVYLDIDDADQPSADATAKQIDKLLPTHFTVQSLAARAEESIKSLSKAYTSITTTFLLISGILAMLVAALVIATTFPSARRPTPSHACLAAHHRREQRPAVCLRTVRGWSAGTHRLHAGRGPRHRTDGGAVPIRPDESHRHDHEIGAVLAGIRGADCVRHRYDRDRLARLRTFRHRRDSTGSAAAHRTERYPSGR